MRHYELMVILDPSLDERNIASSLENFLKVIRNDGGSIEKLDVWGRRRLAYEINKRSEGIYVVVDINSESASVQELDRQLNLNESVLRTKVLRRLHEPRKEARAARAAARASRTQASASA
ncbi:small subunit ribosomal protein S6 [Halopolyspora algeriensis]|uniref:Small ribosomal subunit protein bS6 n=1 Tax=Halopolyspora algeriensis TaxID=1500506 RepID=A0A368W1I8_9ACTN|nr:30S ribosomal protein S6 [Halopolyspora algeriensis]RCW47074.1 small subunit ribosomal protein S6 [Halopolyspora algeriensis]TQM48161.1 small subunit ribosomal protein S6 [Halopolyspora algeriensis]